MSAIADERLKLPRNRLRDISAVEPYRRRFHALKEEGEEIRRLWREIDEAEVRDRAWWLFGEDAKSIAKMRNYVGPIINNTILDAARTLAGGIYSGLTPPSKEWYRIRPASDYLEDDHEVDTYLTKLTAKSRNIIARTMFYAETYGLYWDATFFGITAMLMEDDPQRVINFMRLPPGSYWPASDAKGRINTLYRRYVMTVEQMAEEFGAEKLSGRLRNHLAEGKYDETAIVIQAIEPLRKDDSGAPAWASYESVYFEEAKPEDDNRILKRSHYRVKPFAVFRWSTDGLSPYPRRWPGLDALGDCKQLNLLESDKLLAIENGVKPALAADSKLRGKIKGGYPTPGQVVFVESGSAAEAMAPIIRAPVSIADIRVEIANCDQRIPRALYNNYFLAMLGEKKDMTAAEANFRAEEKAAIIGSVVEQFSGELLPDVITRVTDAIYHHHLAPPPPEALRGMETRYEYIGNLTITAQVLESAKIDSVILFVSQLAQAGQTDGWDNVDIDQAINIKAKSLGVNPDVIRSFDVVKSIRAERQRAAQQQQQAAILQQGAAMARDLGSAKVGDGSMLDAMMGAEAEAGA